MDPEYSNYKKRKKSPFLHYFQILVALMLVGSCIYFVASGGLKQLPVMIATIKGDEKGAESASRKIELANRRNYTSWNAKTKTLKTAEGTIKFTDPVSTDVATVNNIADPNSNDGHKAQRLIYFYYQFTAKKDNQRPYKIFKAHFKAYQGKRKMSDGMQALYTGGPNVDLADKAMEFYNKGKKVNALNHFSYWTDIDTPITIKILDDRGKQIGKLTYPLTDLN